MVAAIFEGLARGGAARQVVAAAAAAVVRCAACLEFEPEEKHLSCEVEERLQAVRPTLEAGLQGKAVCGSARAKRNLAVHNFGIKIGAISTDDAKRIQRGGRRSCGRSPSAVEPGGDPGG